LQEINTIDTPNKEINTIVQDCPCQPPLEQE